MMKVYLLVGKTPFYKDLINYPPKNVEYLPKRTYSYSKDISTYYSSATHTLRRNLSSILLKNFKLPRITYIFKDSSDVIHSNRGILILNRKPWVIDTDHVEYFFGPNIFDKPINSRLKNLVLHFLNSKNCKRIICWSNAAKLSMVNVFKSNDIEKKSEILYPAIPALKKIRRLNNDKIKILYVSSNFVKGGLELLNAFKFLVNKYDNIELIFKCDVTENVRNCYSMDEIKFIPYSSQLLPRNELIRKFHMNSDIFVYPTFGDLFGLGLLDAMVASLPIVTTNIFAIPEIVENGKNGFLIDPPYIWYDKNYLPKKSVKIDQASLSNFTKRLAKSLEPLIESASLRKKMGRYGRRLVEKGKFSIKERNKKLANIYLEALRR